MEFRTIMLLIFMPSIKHFVQNFQWTMQEFGYNLFRKQKHTYSIGAWQITIEWIYVLFYELCIPVQAIDDKCRI